MKQTNLESKLRAEDIVREAGMCSRPEYYSGRGATLSDLNSKILDKVYSGIQKAHGKNAADDFTKMVENIPKLSATDFLLSVYRLEQNNWKYDKKVFGHENGVYVDGPTDEAKMITGMFTIGGVLFGDNDRDETDYIRNDFLYHHGIKPKNGKSEHGYFY